MNAYYGAEVKKLLSSYSREMEKEISSRCFDVLVTVGVGMILCVCVWVCILRLSRTLHSFLFNEIIFIEKINKIITTRKSTVSDSGKKAAEKTGNRNCEWDKMIHFNFCLPWCFRVMWWTLDVCDKCEMKIFFMLKEIFSFFSHSLSDFHEEVIHTVANRQK